MFGQALTTIGLENRTSDNYTPFMERNIAIRGFVVPNNREIGFTAWGDVGPRTTSARLRGRRVPRRWSEPHAGGQPLRRPSAASFTVPFAADDQQSAPARPNRRKRGRLRAARIQKPYVGYDVSAITTGQGYSLWSPTYEDSLGRTMHVIPSHDQGVGGGELRIPVWRVALQTEAYYVLGDAREAVDRPFQLAQL